MKSKETSKYALNEKAKTSKKIYSYLIDLFLEIILIMLFLGAVFTPIFNATSYGKTASVGVYESTLKLEKITLESGLSKLKEGSEYEVLENDALADDYVKRTLNTYLYLHDITQYDVKIDINQTIFKENIDNFKGDSIAYYFLNFKKDKKINVSSDDFDYISYFYNEIIKEDNTNTYFVSYLDKPYKILNETAANYLKKYIYENDDTDLPTKYYNDLISIFNSSRQKGIDELENNYTPYIEELNNYLVHYKNYVNILILSVSLSFLVSHIILFLVFPLIFKNLTTIGKKSFRLVYIRKNKEDTNFLQTILYFFITLFKNIYAIILPIFFMYGTLGLLSYPLVGSVDLFQFVIFSILLSLLSLIFSFINKNHDNLEEFSLSLSLVNKENAIVNANKEEVEEEKDGK